MLLVSRDRTIQVSYQNVRYFTVVSHALLSMVPFIPQRQDGHNLKPTTQGL